VKGMYDDLIYSGFGTIIGTCINLCDPFSCLGVDEVFPNCLHVIIPKQ
jgi:hypothetical protein